MAHAESIDEPIVLDNETPEQRKTKQRFRRKRLLDYTWRSRKNFIPGLILVALATATELIGPVLVGRILNQQVMSDVAVTGVAYYAKLLGLYFLAVVIAAGLGYAAQLLFQVTANDIARLIQKDVFAHLHKLPLSFFDKMPAGKVVSRVTNDSNAVKMLYAQVITRLLTAAVFCFGIFLSLFLLDYRLFLMALLPLPVLYIVFKDFKTKSSLYNQSIRRSLSELNGQLNENIQGMEVIQSLGREERIFKDFNNLNNFHYDTNIKYSKLYSYSAHNITGIMNILVMAAILLYFGYASVSGKYNVPIGNLYVFIEYMRRLFEQFNVVMQRVGNLERSIGAADHIFELLQLDTIEYNKGKLDQLNGDISFKNVHFSYVKNEPVLKGISFEIPAGQSAAFVGATGSGKSTIMNLISGFYPLDEGEIVIDGTNLNDMPLLSMRRHMAIVLQDPFLFKGTIYKNIALDDANITQEEAEQALRDVGGAHLLERLEKGIMSPVGEHGQGYSAGEKQLISFARALAKEPSILILDEATASVDSETESIIQEGITKLQEGRTTLLIAHRLSTIKDADTIYVLNKGEIIESGTHKELIAHRGVYATMYEEQSKSVE